MSATARRKAPGGNDGRLWWAAGAAGLALLLGTNVPERATHGGLPASITGWFTVTLDVLRGHLPWGLPQSLLAAALAALAAAATWGARRAWRATTRRGARVDTAAPHLATRPDLAPLTRAAATAKATALGAPTDPPGVYIGQAVGA